MHLREGELLGDFTVSVQGRAVGRYTLKSICAAAPCARPFLCASGFQSTECLQDRPRVACATRANGRVMANIPVRCAVGTHTCAGGIPCLCACMQHTPLPARPAFRVQAVTVSAIAVALARTLPAAAVQILPGQKRQVLRTMPAQLIATNCLAQTLDHQQQRCPHQQRLARFMQQLSCTEEALQWQPSLHAVCAHCSTSGGRCQ